MKLIIYSMVLLLLGSCTYKKKTENKITENDGWKLVWSDEFDQNGLPDTTRWNYDTRGNEYGWGNNEKQWYNVAKPENCWIENGILVITARKEKTGNKEYSSARLTTKNKGDWKYGKIEVRA